MKLQELAALVEAKPRPVHDQHRQVEKNLINRHVGGILLTPKIAEQRWNGDFDVQNFNLTSLEGAPKSVGGNFYCSHNKLKNLVGGPEFVVEDYVCREMSLTSLKGAPAEIGGKFSCYANTLTTLEGGPTTVGDGFYCFENKLRSLKGCPEWVGDKFSCEDNHLTLIDAAPATCKVFDCVKNNISSLKGIHKLIKEMNGPFKASQNPIKSHVLGLLYIRGCYPVDLDNKWVEDCLNKYLKHINHHDDPERHKVVLACQSELLDNGYEDFAQL